MNLPRIFFVFVFLNGTLPAEIRPSPLQHSAIVGVERDLHGNPRHWRER